MNHIHHNHNHETNNNLDHHHESHSFREELMHHMPYAIFSAALAIIILSLLDYNSRGFLQASRQGYDMLFHSFHFLHILFASTGTVITYSRFAKNQNLLKTLLIGIISPMFFCILSDVVLPYFAGVALGVDMQLHICFHRELRNIAPFLFIGIINGLILRSHHSSMLKVFSLSAHFTHILISSLASLFYMVSHGLNSWAPIMGYVYLLLIVAIVVPCTFSDVIIPMYFAGVKKK